MGRPVESYTREQVERMRGFLPQYLQERFGVRNLRNNFRCPFHNDAKKPSAKYNEGTQTVKCFGACDASWDVFQMVELAEGLRSFREAADFVAARMGLRPEGEYVPEGGTRPEGGSRRKGSVPAPKAYPVPERPDGPDVFEACAAAHMRLFEPCAAHAVKYLRERGFGFSTGGIPEDLRVFATQQEIALHNWGWGWVQHPSEIVAGFERAPRNPAGYVTLPHFEREWQAVRYCRFRPLFDCSKELALPRDVAPQVLWREFLVSCGADAVAVCEGVFDAASFELLTGIPAVSLNGTGGASRLLRVLANTPRDLRPGSLLINLDADDAGRKAAAPLLRELRELGVSASEFPPWPDGAKDANAALQDSLRGLPGFDSLFGGGADGR